MKMLPWGAGGGGLRDRPTDPGQSRCATEHRGPTDSACTSRATGSCALCARPEAVSDLQVGCTVLSVWLLRDRHTPCDSSTLGGRTRTPTTARRGRGRGGARADTHRVHVTARVRPDHGCTVDGSTRHRGSAAQSPRDRSPTLARQRGNHPVRCNRMIRDGYAYGTRGTSTLTDHGEPSPRGRGATRGATWCMACAVVSTCMHVEPRGT